MFFGKILSESQSFKFSADEAEASQGEVLNLTNVILAPTSNGSASLWIREQLNGEEYLIASLTKEQPHASIHLFISLLEQPTLFVKGSGIIHIIGFCEPDRQIEEAEEQPEDEQVVENPNITETAEIDRKKVATISVNQKVVVNLEDGLEDDEDDSDD
jgi:hypothetical protein